MGSTFPLLLMDEIRFSRTGVTAEIFGAGFRPLSLIRPITNTTAKSRKSRIRFLSFRSITSCFVRSRPSH